MNNILLYSQLFVSLMLLGIYIFTFDYWFLITFGISFIIFGCNYYFQLSGKHLIKINNKLKEYNDLLKNFDISKQSWSQNQNNILLFSHMESYQNYKLLEANEKLKNNKNLFKQKEIVEEITNILDKKIDLIKNGPSFK